MKKIYKPQKVAILIPALCALFLASMAIYVLYNTIQPIAVFYILIALCCLMVFVTFRKTKIKIVLSNDYICYIRSSRGLKIKFIDIIKIETSVKAKGISMHGFHIKYQMVLYANEGSLAIDIKPFSRNSMKEITTSLLKKCPTADIDMKTKEMTEGKMPSFFFKYQ